MALRSSLILSNSFVNQNYWNILSVRLGWVFFVSLWHTLQYHPSCSADCVSNTQNIFFDNCCLCKTRRAEAGAQEIYNSIFLCKRTAKAEQIYVKCKQRPFECKGRVILWNWTIFSWINSPQKVSCSFCNVSRRQCQCLDLWLFCRFSDLDVKLVYMWKIRKQCHLFKHRTQVLLLFYK